LVESALLFEFNGRDPITYQSAANKEANIIYQLAHSPAAAKLRQEIWERREEIKALTKHHLSAHMDLRQLQYLRAYRGEEIGKPMQDCYLSLPNDLAIP
jgi:hypothetical protein